jgi:EAL domain-containing protein (putative c-di-GMP-specific phosphodiesterase class I)
LPAADFLALAEQTGLILPLGDWMLKRACVQLAQWADKPELAGIQLAVNVSAQQLRQPDFVQQVLGIVERCGVQPGRLKLELTESMLIDDVDEVISKMTLLKARGVLFSLDDFGTGYSSLSYLRCFPLDTLKVDRSFMSDLVTDEQNQAVVRAVIELGQGLGLEVIAEGVESSDQRDWLVSCGCDILQGYLLSPPLAAADLDRLLRTLVSPAALVTRTEAPDFLLLDCAA